ncbi:hypothetical protein M5K25_001869 [Dendrobium thyrsiflorum]|uniref:VWFA domain-containing protein n=1 Tax=Dendrobium thyrsiflorum TaxID=117978 RepID=A0ABD0VZW6_DENTH
MSDIATLNVLNIAALGTLSSEVSNHDSHPSLHRIQDPPSLNPLHPSQDPIEASLGDVAYGLEQEADAIDQAIVSRQEPDAIVLFLTDGNQLSSKCYVWSRPPTLNRIGFVLSVDNCSDFNCVDANGMEVLMVVNDLYEDSSRILFISIARKMTD